MECSADSDLNRESFSSFSCAARLGCYILIMVLCLYMVRFTGNLDLCGPQIHKPCRSSMGFPVVLPHAVTDDESGKFLVTTKPTLFVS